METTTTTLIPPAPTTTIMNPPPPPPPAPVFVRSSPKPKNVRRKVKGAIFAALLAIGGYSALTTTTASQLSAGDCFHATDAVEVTSVKDQNCAGPHDAQVVGTFELSGTYPGTAVVQDLALDRCTRIAEQAIRDIDALPFDTELGAFYPLSGQGDQTVVCYVSSASGLEGSLL